MIHRTHPIARYPIFNSEISKYVLVKKDYLSKYEEFLTSQQYFESAGHK